jgi:hypothetical protein
MRHPNSDPRAGVPWHCHLVFTALPLKKRKLVYFVLSQTILFSRTIFDQVNKRGINVYVK